MFKFTIITLGKFKEKAYEDLEKLYTKRLRSFAKLNVIQLPEVPYKTKQQMEAAKAEEANKVIGAIPKGSIVILLDEKGQQRDSKELASFLERLTSFGEEICFVVGSGAGLDENLKQYSNYQIALSKLTFPHNLARVILCETLYRTCTIINGIDYHK